MQTKEELEQWYVNKDPWNYADNRDDHFRVSRILALAHNFKSDDLYDSALDIGAGEGWMTKHLPAHKIYGHEISDTAASRFPDNVQRVIQPEGKYDLVITAGTLYQQYDWRLILDLIHNHSNQVVIVAGIKDWIVPQIAELGEPTLIEEFKYREYTQRINVYTNRNRNS